MLFYSVKDCFVLKKECGYMEGKIKREMISQSLSPLFLLLLIRHCHCCRYFGLVVKFFSQIGDFPLTVKSAFQHELLGELIVFIISAFWVIRSFLYLIAFTQFQRCNFESKGERVKNVSIIYDAPIFFVTYGLPLLVDDLSTPQYWISYLMILAFVYIVLSKTNLYYQNPVLCVFKYHVYEFEVDNPDSQALNGFKENVKYIGFSRGNWINNNTMIKWKWIADDIYLIYEDYTLSKPQKREKNDRQ